MDNLDLESLPIEEVKRIVAYCENPNGEAPKSIPESALTHTLYEEARSYLTRLGLGADCV